MEIFVSVASYRDSELVPTIIDCLSKARWPSSLKFGVCWQFAEDEHLPTWITTDPRFIIIKVPANQSLGACWARSEIMKLWNGEDYYFQIDSHHRFEYFWDEYLLKTISYSTSKNTLITTYCPPYDPTNEYTRHTTPTKIEFSHFSEDGIPLFKPSFIKRAYFGNILLKGRFHIGSLYFHYRHFCRTQFLTIQKYIFMEKK